VRTEDPEYQRIGELATKTCARVDEKYTQRFLSEAQSMQAVMKTEGIVRASGRS